MFRFCEYFSSMLHVVMGSPGVACCYGQHVKEWCVRPFGVFGELLTLQLIECF